MIIKENITGVILAGGKSRRMGRDKGNIVFNGLRFVQHIASALKPLVNDLMIIANNGKYGDLNIQVYQDLIKDQGPVGGIYTALSYTKTPYILVVSCDCPLIGTPLLKHLISNAASEKISTITHNNHLEPLIALYHKKHISVFQKYLETGQNKLQDIVKALPFKTVEATTKKGDFSTRNFLNINTPEEFKNLKSYQL